MFLKKFDKKLVRQALEKNMIGKFAYLAGLTSGMKVSNDEITVVNSHQPSDMFNIVCNTRTNKLDQIEAVIKIFEKENLPFAWWTGFQKEPKKIIDQMEKLNLHCTESELGMAVMLANLPAKNAFQGLDIKYVDNDAALTDFISVLTELVPNDKKAIENFYLSTKKFILNPEGALKLFVGYLNNRPIATSALFSYAGVAGIWDIITLPDARRKGIGTDMTLHALIEGKKLGSLIGVLTASDEGQPVYKKLGFEPIQQFYIFNLK